MQGLSHHLPLRLARSLADRPDGSLRGVRRPVYSSAQPMQALANVRSTDGEGNKKAAKVMHPVETPSGQRERAHALAAYLSVSTPTGASIGQSLAWVKSLGKVSAVLPEFFSDVVEGLPAQVGDLKNLVLCHRAELIQCRDFCGP